MTATNSNFYQIGASLPVDAPSYVRRQADEEFYQKLQAGKFCYVLNSRQMGKSSLRVQTMQRLQKEGTVCAAIDLTGIGKVNQQQWYGGIVYNLSESCQLEDKFDFDWQEWWQKHQTVLSPVQCLSLFIEKVLLVKIEQPIVIFVDEIDKVLSQDFSADDFFGLIRFFQNQRVDNPIFERLTFALLGVATPSDLIQNKTQTPFNIGEAIELHGFKFDEVEPLIKGLQGKCDRPQVVMNEILNWTGGQPFLTQKLCKFMVEKSEKDNSLSVKEVVNKRIIENWESQDDPEHLRTIRDRILSSEQRAGYLLELYQQIQQQGEVAAKKNLEYSELRLSGLVVKREGKLRVYNRVYQKVFNQTWVETQLKNLRPYSENYRFWIASGGKDESRLLQGNALREADKWAKDKNLSFQDKQFLAASREKEIAVRNQEAELERERKDREAAEKRNLVLSKANKKAKRRISIGSVVLGLTLLGAVTIGISANKQLDQTQQEVVAVRELNKLAGELQNQTNSSSEDIMFDSTEALRLSALSFNINNHKLKQALVSAASSQAHQQLEKLKKAEEEINQSNIFLKQADKKVLDSREGLQIKVLFHNYQGSLLAQNKETQSAIEHYRKAFNILKKHSKETDFTKDNQLLTAKEIESVHRGLLKLESNRDRQVWNSLKEHFYARLENSLKLKNWRAANLITERLVLFIADRETGVFGIPEIDNFSCSELKKIDDLWVQNSKGNYGFSVQKRIWIETGNRLGSWSGNNYLRFASRLGWYNGENNEIIKENPAKWARLNELFFKEKIKTGGLPIPKWATMAGGYPYQGTVNLFSRCDL